MNFELKGIHLEIKEDVRDYIDKKLTRLAFAENLVVGLTLNLSKEGGGYKFDSTIHFRWGTVTRIGQDTFNIIEGIDKLFDKIERKVNKEKVKVQEHRGPGLKVPTEEEEEQE